MAIVGLGRVGSALALALRQRRMPVVVWDRTESVRRDARRRLPGALVVETARDAWLHGDIVILAVPDTAIARQRVPHVPRRVVAHTSGRLTAADLPVAARAVHATASFHPLRSFGRRWDGSRLAGTLFAVEGDAEAVAALLWLGRRVGGTVARLHPGAKPLYHAAAALAANHAALLALLAERWMTVAGVSRNAAREGIATLAASAIEGVRRRGIAGLTGPLARGDAAAIRCHVEALRRADPQSVRTYRELIRRALLPGGGLGGHPARTRRSLLLAAGSRSDPDGSG